MAPSRTNEEQAVLEKDCEGRGKEMDFSTGPEVPSDDGATTVARSSKTVDERAFPVTTDDSREIQRCYDLGANVYITKPVDYDGFANAIRQLGLFFSVIQVPEAV